MVGHAALSAIHATGIGAVVSGPIHLIYGAAHAIHTAVTSTEDIIEILKIGKDAAVAAYLKYIVEIHIKQKLLMIKLKIMKIKIRKRLLIIQMIKLIKKIKKKLILRRIKEIIQIKKAKMIKTIIISTK